MSLILPAIVGFVLGYHAQSIANLFKKLRPIRKKKILPMVEFSWVGEPGINVKHKSDKDDY